MMFNPPCCAAPGTSGNGASGASEGLDWVANHAGKNGGLVGKSQL